MWDDRWDFGIFFQRSQTIREANADRSSLETDFQRSLLRAAALRFLVGFAFNLF
jgi:hypothetical protein